MALTFQVNLGAEDPLGHLDFYPDGGVEQEHFLHIKDLNHDMSFREATVKRGKKEK